MSARENKLDAIIREAIQERQSFERFNKKVSTYAIPNLPRRLYMNENKFISELCKDNNVLVSSVKAKKKGKTEIVEVRYLVMYFLYYRFNLKLRQIGEILGRDHSSVTTGIKTMCKFLEVDENFRLKFERAKKILDDGALNKMLSDEQDKEAEKV